MSKTLIQIDQEEQKQVPQNDERDQFIAKNQAELDDIINNEGPNAISLEEQIQVHAGLNAQSQENIINQRDNQGAQIGQFEIYRPPVQEFLQQNQLQDEQILQIRQAAQLFEQTQIDFKIKVFQDFFLGCNFQTFINLMKLILTTIAYVKSNNCGSNEILTFLILGIIQAGSFLLLQFYLSYHIYSEYYKLKKNRENTVMQYSDQELQNPSTLFEGFQDRNQYFRYFRYISLMYYVVFFFYGNITVLSNLSNDQCQIGVSSTNFIWAVIIIILILSYFSVGFPLILVVLYLLVAPIFILLAGTQQRTVTPVNYEIQKEEQLEQVDDNPCVICLVDYAVGDEYVVLPCNILHMFHKKCIFDWLHINDQCPLCKKRVDYQEQVPQQEPL